MTNFTLDKNSTDDVLDVRDIIARVEELRAELQAAMDENEEGHNFTKLTDYVKSAASDASAAHSHKMLNEANELLQLEAFLEELKGGGDEQWEGQWYAGVPLIADHYFVDYVRELLEDCGDIPKNLPPYIEIDWRHTAQNIRADYSPVDLSGETYWTRF